MYHYLDDKEFVSKMRNLCGDIMQDLCHILKEDYDIGATFYLVGSGARNLIMQNNNEPADLDYNLEIIRCEDFEDCRYIKECVRKSFNKALKVNDLDDCNDSTVPGKWMLVRQQYEKIKNMYLIRNDYNHPSFVCYVEAVNNVYNLRKRW